ncbi:MAG: HAMP domain-containing protein [Deltaproteobacteria bacterium]|jgi:nitrogen fixation/metabolism regulation signal transduction histidine kinase|nr:HAMP domain-containing protein [Deltaproteobacteria bacterium]
MPDKEPGTLPGEPEARPAAERRRRGKRHEKIFVVLAVLGLLLLVAIQRRLLNLGPGLSSNQGVVTLVSINLSILTLTLLLFLILKGLYRVFFERQAYGSLQTKMVVSFISLSLIPTILIFYFAYRLVGHGGETWFSQNQAELAANSIAAVEEAADIRGKLFPALARGALWEFAGSDCARRAADDPSTIGPGHSASGALCADSELADLRERFGLASLEWYAPDGRRLASSSIPLPGGAPPVLDASVLGQGPSADGPVVIEPASEGVALRRLVFPVPVTASAGDPWTTTADFAPGARAFESAVTATSYAQPGASGTAVSTPGAPVGRLPSPDLSPASPGVAADTSIAFLGVTPTASQAAPDARSDASSFSGAAVDPSRDGSPGFPADAPSPVPAPLGYLAAGDDGPEGEAASLESLREGLLRAEAALGIERPFRVSQLTSLAAVTLLAVFLSVWIGSHLAGSLAAPVTELVEGTRRVAGGDLDFVLTPVHRSGEMADLVAAFNQMTAELKSSYAETDRRRRFVEAVLAQVSSGVMVLAGDLSVVDMNQAAVEMLRLPPGEARRDPARGPVKELAGPIGSGTPPKGYLRLALPGGDSLSLMVDRAPLKGEGGDTLGWLITFDDISELEKAQRLSAWREVARRIAHEIKNPLTPISLAAQRLNRRFGPRLESEEDYGVFTESTGVIIRQVDGMRRLVDEFSQFARLPQADPRPSDISRVAEEAVALFRGAQPGVEFSLNVPERPPLFLFDPEQIGRAVANLISNACRAVKGAGKVVLDVGFDPDSGVELTVSDDGPGIPPEIRERVFEPYVTGGDGQGLGLAIVKAIVTDHGGFVRVFDRTPKGTAFTLTLPFKDPAAASGPEGAGA